MYLERNVTKSSRDRKYKGKWGLHDVPKDHSNSCVAVMGYFYIVHNFYVHVDMASFGTISSLVPYLAWPVFLNIFMRNLGEPVLYV